MHRNRCSAVGRSSSLFVFSFIIEPCVCFIIELKAAAHVALSVLFSIIETFLHVSKKEKKEKESRHGFDWCHA